MKLKKPSVAEAFATIAFFIAMSVVATGCNNTGCSDNRSALPLAVFCNAANGKEIMLDSLAIGGVNAPGDSLLLKAGNSAYELYLPFRATEKSVSFYIEYHYPALGYRVPADNDTITFDYVSTPLFASEECGAYYAYTITGVQHTRHLLERVALADSTITNVNRDWIKLYFNATRILDRGNRPALPAGAMKGGVR